MQQGENGIFPIDEALEMIIMFDTAGKICYANGIACQNLEYEDDLCGRWISDVFPNSFPANSHINFDDDIKKGLQEFVAYRKNTTCFPAEGRIVKSDSQPGLYIGMFNDVLERKFLGREVERVKHEAEEAMKVKSEFVANVTHELRTPVNGVLGNVRELLERDQDAETEKILRIIERCCGDMNKIINNILDFSKLEAGKFTLEPRKFSFRNMMDYVKSNHINDITEKGLQFFMTVSPQVPEYMIGDELRIVQILNNLLSNARKFTSWGKIMVEVFRTAKVNDKMELFFVISDTGIGIDKADKDKLFQSFSQVDASISRKYGGTGLGLNICKQLVELMGGDIEVESEKNKGSQFSFSIWVGICEEDEEALQQPDDLKYQSGERFYTDSADEETEDIRRYGTEENQKNLETNLSKLILCIEMENWEKAEDFMEVVRQLVQDAPQEVKRMVLGLKMAVQKEDYDKAEEKYKMLDDFLQQERGLS